MRSIVGKWQLFVDWGNSGNPITASELTFKSDGTWSYQFGGGTWVQAGSIVTFDFTNASGLMYSGTINSISMGGGMGYTGQSGNNSFYCTPSGTKHISIEKSKAEKDDRAIG
ncbi:hypothetical protein ATE84_2678 [Aquimarina sp. MAR_2010_214]|uniref:hypothetical protein n=1 Tax=Aquimarina sp. MAR_2010_214 TaxID=1250026 RepID=UPI000C70C3E9|nr:hypothetical protein [Aquimarina sp. MAR_2010_214]PKV50616.1 hypothetical protein ATE84_2678 [Aquimarina sp. MAR_2010_214]